MLRSRNLISGAIFIALGVILYISASEPRETMFADPNAMDIMLYPKILIGVWICASFIYAISPRSAPDWNCLWQARIPLISGLAAIGLYMLMFPWLGLFLSTLIFLLIFFWIMGYRDPKKAIPVALICSALAWLVFEYILGLVMPQPFFMEYIG